MQIEERDICCVAKANGRGGGGGGGRITKIERDLHNSSNHAKPNPIMVLLFIHNSYFKNKPKHANLDRGKVTVLCLLFLGKLEHQYDDMCFA